MSTHNICILQGNKKNKINSFGWKKSILSGAEFISWFLRGVYKEECLIFSGIIFFSSSFNICCGFIFEAPYQVLWLYLKKKKKKRKR